MNTVKLEKGEKLGTPKLSPSQAFPVKKANHTDLVPL